MNPLQVGSLAVAVLGLVLLSISISLVPISIGLFGAFDSDLGFSRVYTGMLIGCAMWFVTGLALLALRSRIASWLLRVPHAPSSVSSVPGSQVAVGLLGVYLAVTALSSLVQTGVHLFISGPTDLFGSTSGDLIYLLFGMLLVLRSRWVLQIFESQGARAA